MNWVAHFVLSQDNENLIVGNWLGEVVRAKDYQNYPKQIAQGILLHREIDTFTDAHPIVKSATHIFHEEQGKFSPVVLDMMYDYFLIQNWNTYRNDSYSHFSQKIYDILYQQKNLYPKNLQKRTDALLKYQWLEMYTTLEGIAEVLRQMSLRTPYPNNMGKAVEVVHTHYAFLQENFNSYFPELQRHCQNCITYFQNKNEY